MIVSEEREYLLSVRKLMLECIAICLRTGNMGTARSIGKSSAIINEKLTKTA